MNFRYFLNAHDLARKIFTDVAGYPSGAGVLLKEGTLVNITIIEAPSSTKNKKG